MPGYFRKLVRCFTIRLEIDKNFQDWEMLNERIANGGPEENVDELASKLEEYSSRSKALLEELDTLPF